MVSMFKKCDNCSNVPQLHESCEDNYCTCNQVECIENREFDFGELLEIQRHVITVEILPNKEFLEEHKPKNPSIQSTSRDAMRTVFGEAIKEALNTISDKSMLYWINFIPMKGVQCMYNENYFHVAEKPVIFQNKVSCRECVSREVKKWEAEAYNEE